MNHQKLLLNGVKTFGSTITLYRDFNIHFLVDSKSKQKILDLTSNLEPIVTTLTRITNTSKPALPQVFITKQESECLLKVFNSGFSDHEAGTLKITATISKLQQNATSVGKIPTLIIIYLETHHVLQSMNRIF